VRRGSPIRVMIYALKRKLSYWKQILSLQSPRSRQALNNIYLVMPDILDTNSSDFENTTQVRNWVNENSIHLIDKEHDSYAFDLSKVVIKVWQYFQVKERPPHLSCGPRAYLLRQLLEQLGYSCRVIDIFEIVAGEPRSHTLVEYYDTCLNKWVMQDPDFNACYLDKNTELPLGAAEALEYAKSDIIAGGGQFENKVNLDGTIDDYFFAVVVYRYSYVGEKAIMVFSHTCDVYCVENGMAIDAFCKYLQERYDVS